MRGDTDLEPGDLANYLHSGDLPAGVFDGAEAVAVDSETMGLALGRDPLCVVQLSDGKGDAHLVQLDRSTYDAPNLKKVLTDPGDDTSTQRLNNRVTLSRLHSTHVSAPWRQPR